MEDEYKNDMSEETIENAYADEEPINNDEAISSDAPEPIEDAPEVLDATDKKKKKKDKKKKAEDNADATPKKTMKKSSKIAIIVISVILALAIIVTSITVPLVLKANKGKIFVSKVEDFQNTKGDTYVLNDDLSVAGDLALGDVNNIDLNGKTLTIQGVLTINNNSDSAVLLGKGEGTLQAATINVVSKADVVIGSLTKVDDMNISAPNIVINSGVNVSEKATLSGNKVEINAKFEFANSERVDKLHILDASEIVLASDISGNVSITNPTNVVEDGYSCAVKVSGNIKGSLLADGNTEVSVLSRISDKIDTSDYTVVNGVPKANSKVGKVKLYETSFVTNVTNASIVYVHKDAVYPNMSDVDVVDIIRQLERVGYIAVDDSTETIMLSFGKVEGAKAYEIVIDGNTENKIVTDVNLVDISEYVRDIHTHNIAVRAMADAGNELLLPSDMLNYEYTTYTTLKKAENILITNVDGVMTLTFDEVPFADEYIININGEKIVTTETSVDVTSILRSGGAYVVNIVSTSKNDNILQSKPSMYQYDHKVQLDTPEFTITNRDGNVVFSWSEVKNAKYYKLVCVNDNRAWSTASNEIVLPIDGNNFETKIFKVVAVSASPYYLQSESITVTYHG